MPPKESKKDKQIENRELSQELQDSYIDYAMSVIVSRALPDVRDGLKPVQRRILYTMYEDKLFHNASFKKSATVVGNTLARYHPHGDSPVYGALVRLAQPFSLRYPLVTGQGNFGSLDDPSEFAAMRYTEAKLSEFGQELLKDIDKDTVDFIPNYDGSRQEPVVLPSPLPNLLLNGAMGIAVGMATNIPPHNLNEVIDALVLLLDKPKAGLEEILEIIKGPDFPTGGFIFDKKAIKSAYTTGKGSILVRGKAEIEERKGSSLIVISEIPYGSSKAQLLSQIARLAQEKKQLKIRELRDESDREGMRIVVELKKDASPNRVLNHLYKHTVLETRFYLNMIALVDGIHPRLLNLKDLLEQFLEHRLHVVSRKTTYELKKAKERVHILEGLVKALRNIDKVIDIIKKAESREKAREKLMRSFKLSELQANAILDMRLGSLARLERGKIQEEEKELKKRIKELESILRSKTKIKNILKKELREYKERFGDERRTKVILTPPKQLGWQELVPDEEAVIILTKKGFIKRVSPTAWRTQKRGGKGSKGAQIREEDEILRVIFAHTHDLIFFFTDEGRVLAKRAFEIPVGERTSKGKSVLTFLDLKGGEKVIELRKVSKDREKEGYFVFVTEQGVCKRSSVARFSSSLGRGIRALSLKTGDKLVCVLFTLGEDDVLLFTKQGKSIRFKEKELREMGRSAQGVKGIELEKEDKVVASARVNKEEKKKARILLVTEKGYAKQSRVSEFRAQKRGGKGIKAMRLTQKTGEIVEAKVLTGKEKELILVSQQGQTVKTDLSSIPTQGRISQGVRVMKLKGNDRVASIAVVE